MHAAEAVRTESCPKCGEPVIVDGVFPPWCPQCDWGLRPPIPPKPRTAIERIGARVAERSDRRLTEGLPTKGDLEPRLTAGRVAATAIAVVVLLLWLAVIAGAVWFGIVLHTPIAILIGIGLAGLAWLMRPWPGRVPKEGVVLPESAPELHALVAEVAAALDVAPPALIVVDRAFNASWSTVGFRRRRVLTLGLPLLAALEGQELVALLAHELGHERNGDPVRSLVIGSSIGALAAVYVALTPQFEEDTRQFAVLGDAATVLTNVVALPFRLVLELQLSLLLRDSRRAEYLADDRAAAVAGTAGAVALAEKTLLEGYVDAVLQRHASGGEPDAATTLAVLRAAVRDVPERERERRRRSARLEQPQFFSTHPPTARRIALLQRRAPRPAAIVVGPERERRIEAELAA